MYDFVIQREAIMNSKLRVFIIHFFLILLFIGVFYIEIVTYSVTTPERGGMSYSVRFENLWHRSFAFYAIIILFVSLLFQVAKKNK